MRRSPVKRFCEVQSMYRFAFVVVAPLLAASPAFAITCHGEYQVVGGQEISTPFCRDNALGALARRRGFDISDASIRNYPGRKDEICRFLRYDINAQPACAEVDPGSSRR
jgi:hypothetical protein